MNIIFPDKLTSSQGGGRGFKSHQSIINYKNKICQCQERNKMNPFLNPVKGIRFLKHFIFDPKRLKKKSPQQINRYRDKVFKKRMPGSVLSR